VVSLCFLFACRMTSPPYSIVALMQKIDCIHNSAVMELMRGLRNQLTELITGLGAQELGPMSLGLSHSLSRYKLKFSPEKVSLNIYAQFRVFFCCPKYTYLISSDTVSVHFTLLLPFAAI
jgi:hypothetical protein